MPTYATPMAGGVFTSLCVGQGPYFLFNNEAVTTAEASTAISRATSPSGADNGITFQMEFASAPTAGIIEILATNVPQSPKHSFNLNEWSVVYTSTTDQTQSYTDIGRSEFYCAYAVTGPSGNLTVTANR
jgi:hypothetical protein